MTTKIKAKEISPLAAKMAEVAELLDDQIKEKLAAMDIGTIAEGINENPRLLWTLLSNAFFCVVCGRRIDEIRLRRRATTCTPEHAALGETMRREIRARERCRLCSRPCTPKEKELWKEFRHWMVQQGHAEKAKLGRPAGKKNKADETEELNGRTEETQTA